MLCHITQRRADAAGVHRLSQKHPEVWRMFTELAFEAIRVGFKSYSAAVIFEVIRHMKNMGGDGVTCFKLNNNYRAFYARAFHKSSRSTKAFSEPASKPAQIRTPRALVR